MKLRRSLILLVLAGWSLNAAAEVFTYNFTSGFANAGVVPDGNTTGWSDTRTISGIDPATITDVNVSLNITGGYAGDLYVYLTHGSGFSVLLNRVGRSGASAFGYSDSGLNLSFDDAAANGDVHNYQAVSGYSTLINSGAAWSPDGRNVNPLTVLNTSSRTSFLDQFNSLDPNGGWTLFVGDLSGGAQATVAGWGLNIVTTAVPEPSMVGLFALGALALRLRKGRA